MDIDMTSKQIHDTLAQLYNQAELVIRGETHHTGQIIFSTFCHRFPERSDSPNINFTIRTGYSSNGTEIEVTGRDFWDCIAEFIRRAQFAKRQANLQLGPPTIDASTQ
jgi:hypothetical protein